MLRSLKHNLAKWISFWMPLSVLVIITQIYPSYSQDLCLSRTKKKLIEWGWDQPTTRFLRENIEKMEKRPFDGVIFDVQYARGEKTLNFAWTCFGNERIEPILLDGALNDLKATKFRKFTDNFLRFNVCPGDVDWFDDWSAVLSNARLAAHIAKEGGIKGWMFDVEQYHHGIFNYGGAKYAGRASFDEYARQAKRRGEQFIRVINREYPDITILLTFGHSLLRDRARRGTRLDQQHYGLAAPFLDGMLSAATDETKIVDAFEMAYPYKTRGQFLEGYHKIKNQAIEVSSEPDRYRLLVRAGFGLWIDHAWRSRGWYTKPDEFSKNLRTPAEMEEAVRAALETSDEYVWLYSEQLNWWSGKNVPQEYADAVDRARAAVQDIGSEKVLGRTMPPLDGRAQDQPGYDDKSTFDKLWQTYGLIADLPKTWRLKLDPKDEGKEQNWYAVDLDESDWKPIQIGEWWEQQGYHYNGIAWYRVNFKAPAEAKGRKLALSFGAVDESAWVYLNGKELGEFNQGEGGWDKRFEIPLGDAVKIGADNLLAVRVWDRAVYGGIWKSVKLVAEK